MGAQGVKSKQRAREGKVLPEHGSHLRSAIHTVFPWTVFHYLFMHSEVLYLKLRHQIWSDSVLPK